MPSQGQAELQVTVVDENSVPIPSARVVLTALGAQVSLRGETDHTGRIQFANLTSSSHTIHVEKEDFYAVDLADVGVGEIDSIDVTLNHVREFTEVVDVVYSPPSIDPVETSSSETLTSQEIVNLPYTVTRDIRYALPMMPGVVQDAFGQVHVAGASTRQVRDHLDGFNVTHPSTGLFNLRVSVDALRSVELLSTRYPAEHGKASAGVLNLRTGMGDDRFRFSATDFVPSIQNRNGLHINTWTPRATITGPLRKGKAWFLQAFDGEYNLTIVEELPAGADRNPAWRFSNLSKGQINLSPSNILTASLVVNQFRSDYAGLSPFDPQETTVSLENSAYWFAARDQHFLSGGALLETGVALSEYRESVRPLGERTYTLTPEGRRGNYFAAAEARAGRLQAIANLFLPPLDGYGRHFVKAGFDVDRVTHRESVQRRPMQILRDDGTLSREIAFTGAAPFSRSNFEAGGYVQDRWSVSDRVTLEPGIRLDWDAVVRDVLVSPRFASTLLLTRDGNTKLAWGIGLYHDATYLVFLNQALTGRRFDLFYDPTGEDLVRPPVETSFRADEAELKQGRFLNWSVSLERKLPQGFYLELEFLRRRGARGWTFLNLGPEGGEDISGRFELRPVRRDRYDAFEISLRRVFKGNHVVYASYLRSGARSNAVLSFSIDSPLFSQQAGGPLPWDTPHRFISWGWLPLPRGFQLAYWLDWRDGFPFSLVNEDQQLVGPPGSRRFPDYFSLNVHVERRFRIFGFQWALRAGVANVTGRANPSAVNNNVDSPQFLTFAGLQSPAFTGRIRFLGRK